MEDQATENKEEKKEEIFIELDLTCEEHEKLEAMAAERKMTVKELVMAHLFKNRKL